MAAGHGGARPGSGRKPKTTDKPAAPSRFDDPLAYLIAVATGAEPGEGSRIAAAKAALPYTQPKARAPVESPPPRAIRRRAETRIVAAERDSWATTEAEIRARLSKLN